MRQIINLKQQAILTTHKHPANLRGLPDGITLLTIKGKIKHSKNCIPSMMIQHNRWSRQMLVLHPPKPNILLTTWYKFLCINRRELYRDYVEVAQLFCDQ